LLIVIRMFCRSILDLDILTGTEYLENIYASRILETVLFTHPPLFLHFLYASTVNGNYA